MSKILVVRNRKNMNCDETKYMCYDIISMMRTNLPDWALANIDTRSARPSLVKIVLRDILNADAEGISPIVVTNVPESTTWDAAFQVIGATDLSNLGSGINIVEFI